MKPQKPTCQVWVKFRSSVIGPLLANPPDKGKITFALKTLAEQTWTHPITGEPAKWSSRSLERWYIAAKQERYDSVALLATKKREDTGPPPEFSARKGSPSFASSMGVIHHGVAISIGKTSRLLCAMSPR